MSDEVMMVTTARVLMIIQVMCEDGMETRVVMIVGGGGEGAYGNDGDGCSTVRCDGGKGVEGG